MMSHHGIQVIPICMKKDSLQMSNFHTNVLKPLPESYGLTLHLRYEININDSFEDTYPPSIISSITALETSSLFGQNEMRYNLQPFTENVKMTYVWRYVVFGHLLYCTVMNDDSLLNSFLAHKLSHIVLFCHLNQKSNEALHPMACIWVVLLEYEFASQYLRRMQESSYTALFSLKIVLFWLRDTK